MLDGVCLVCGAWDVEVYEMNIESDAPDLVHCRDCGLIASMTAILPVPREGVKDDVPIGVVNGYGSHGYYGERADLRSGA
jgi:N-dimethylarginine dimethylaminohydrolase